MDPFSILGVTASIIACVQLTGSLLQSVGRSDHDRADLNRILQVVTGFGGSYEGLKLCLQFNENDHSRLSSLQHLEGPLKDSKAVLEFLQKRLENMGFVNQFILGKIFDGKLKRSLKVLEDAKALLELAMHSDQHIILTAVETYTRNAAEDIRDVKGMVNDSNSRLVLLEKSTRESHEEAKEMHSQTLENVSRITTQIQRDSADNERIERNKIKQKIINWLSKVDPTTDHNTAYAKHEPETGTWFLQGQEYIEWKGRPASSLWLNGIPGCGKTTLCATIIEDLKSHFSTGPSRPLAFFYFSFNDTKKQQINSLLCSIIAQLAAQSHRLSEDMQNLYQNYHPGQPPLEVLKTTLRSILGQPGDKYIVIDALDECPSQEGERGQLCALLQEISSWELPLLHILTTSRREPDIEEAFAQIPNVSRVPIQNALVDADILKYVEAQLAAVPKLARWKPHLKEEIREALVEGAHGMFRWAFCQIDALRKCLNPNAVRKALKTLPKSLDDTYDRIFLGIDPDYQEYASAALKWLVFSERPLFLSELAEAAIVQPQATVPFDIENRFQSADDILHILSGLVTIQIRGTLSFQDDFYAPGYDDTTSPIVRLAHFSVKEYLISDRISRGPATMFSLNESLSCQMILESCLSYFEHYSTTGSEPFDECDLDDFPLLSYSCEYWPIHAMCQIKFSTIDMLSRCLSTERWLASWMTATDTWHGTFEAWLDYDGTHGPTSFDELLKDNKTVLNVALYVVSFLNLNIMLQPLIKLGADPNRWIPVDYQYPIIAAASMNQYSTVQELIHLGADIAVTARDGRTALHAAVRTRDSKIAYLLFENGFDVNMGVEGLKTPDNPPIITAICLGGPSMIRMLLEKGARVDLHAVCELLETRYGLDEEGKLLISEFSDVFGQNHKRLPEFLLQVYKILERRRNDLNKLMISGPRYEFSPRGEIVLPGSDS